MKTIIVSIVLLGLTAAGAIAFSASRQGTPVEAASVREGEISEFIDERGKTRLPQTYSITMPYDGRVERIDLVEGTEVKQGQIVARVVPKDLDLAVAAAQAAVERIQRSIVENADASVEKTGLAQSLSFVSSMESTVEAARQRVASGQAKLDYAEANLKRITQAQQAFSEDQLDRARLAQIEASIEFRQDQLVLRAIEAMQVATNLMPTALQQYIDRKSLSGDVLEKQLAEAEVRLEQELTQQRRGEMKSPIDGVILERHVSNEGQTPGGTELLTIGRLENLEIEADILSQDVVNVKIGNPVEVSGPAIGLKPVRGSVSRIYPAGFVKVSSLGVEQQRVKVIVALDAEDLARLRAERQLGVDYRVRVRIFTAQQSQTRTIPRSALFRGAAGEWQVFAVRDGAAVLQEVQVGLMNDEFVEVVDGLEVNEAVILAPETTLVEGQRVQPVLRDAMRGGHRPSRE